LLFPGIIKSYLSSICYTVVYLVCMYVSMYVCNVCISVMSLYLQPSFSILMIILTLQLAHIPYKTNSYVELEWLYSVTEQKGLRGQGK
jgi:hypothetical protein